MFTDSKTEDKCDLGEKTGNSGSYGSVFVSSTNNNLVIKIPNKNYYKYKFSNILYPEVDSLYRIKSSFIVHGSNIYLKDSCGEGKDIGLEMERAVGPAINLSGNIDQKGNKNYKQPYDIMKRIIVSLGLGIRCLHRNNLLHLDLSENNVMYSYVNNDSKQPIAKIIDLGLSNYVEKDQNNKLNSLITYQQRVTSTSRPPELFNQKKYICTDKVDIWSYAMIIISFLRGETLFDFFQISKAFTLRQPTEKEVDNYIFNKINLIFKEDTINNNLNIILSKYVPSKELESLIDLLSNMLKFDPNERFSIEQVIDHKYFSMDPLNRKNPENPILPYNFKRNIQSSICKNGDCVCSIEPVHNIHSNFKFTSLKSDGLKFIFSTNN